MKCKKCGGDVHTDKKVHLCVYLGGVHCVQIYEDACPCKVCGLLHWLDDGEKVSRESTGEDAYLENGKVVAKKI